MEVDAPLLNEDAPPLVEDEQIPAEDVSLTDVDPVNTDTPQEPAAEESPFATRWREIYRRSPRTMARSVALSALDRWQSVTGKTSSWLAAPRVQILLLHHVFPDEERAFRRLLKLLTRTSKMVSYSEALHLATIGGAEMDRPFVPCTFDDGFKNCVRAGEILKEFNAGACFFICPSMIGENDMVKVRSFCSDRLELVGRPVEFMDADDLTKLKSLGHEIGGHTMTHANLAKVTPQQATDEIGKCFDVIKRNFGEAKHFAWTYGKFTDCTGDAARDVFRTGFTSCASGERGCHGPNRAATNQPLCVRRDHVIAGAPLSHVRYFLAKASADMSPHTGDWPPWWGDVKC